MVSYPQLIYYWLRQQAFHRNDKDRYQHYRNRQVNRERKSLRSRYYVSKISNLKNTKPSQWWPAAKQIAGMTPASASDCLLSNLRCVDRLEHTSDLEISNAVNTAFLEPMKFYKPLHPITLEEDDSEALIVTEPGACFWKVSKLFGRI